MKLADREASLTFGCVFDLLLTLFRLDALVYFLTMHRYFPRGIDTNPYLVPLDTQNGNRDFVTDHQSLSDSPR